MQFICEHLSSPPQQVNRKPAVETKPIAPQPTGEVINVRYIYCNGLFTKDIREKQLVGLDSGQVTMVDLYSKIGEQEQLDGQEMNLELFSFEGYPLNANDFTVDCKCCYCCMLYVGMRTKHYQHQQFVKCSWVFSSCASSTASS